MAVKFTIHFVFKYLIAHLILTASTLSVFV